MQMWFEEYKTIIIFLHILSAVVWVGGMIAIKFAVHPVIQTIEEPKIRLGNSLRIVKRLFNLVMPFIALSFICALIIIKETGYAGGFIHLKEAIWTMMTLNYTYMYIKRTLAQKSFDQGNFVNAKEHMRLLPTILLPINIVLGVVAIFLGVMLKS